MKANISTDHHRLIPQLIDLLNGLDDFDQASEAAMPLWASRFLEQLASRLDLEGCVLLISSPDGFQTLATYATNEGTVGRIAGTIKESESASPTDTAVEAGDGTSGVRGVQIRVVGIDGKAAVLTKAGLTEDHVLWSVFLTGRKPGHDLRQALSVVAVHLARMIAGTLLIREAKQTSNKLTQANHELKEMQVCSLNIMEDLRRRNRDLRMLNAVAQEMAQRTTLPELAEAAAETASRMLDGTTVGVFVAGGPEGALSLSYVTGGETIEDPELCIIKPHDGVYSALSERADVRFDSIDEAMQPAIARAVGCKTGLVTPLYSKKELLGCLVTCECRWHRVFTDEEVENLRMLANTLAVAIENARLLSQTARQVEEMSILKEYVETVVDSVDLAVLVVNADLEITMFSKGFERIYGYQQHDYVGKRLFEAFPYLLEQGFAEIVQQVLNGEPFERFGWRRQLPDGREVVQNLRVSPHRDASGRIIGGIAIIGDVTEKANLEDQLEKSEAKFRRLVEDLDDAYFVIRGGKIAYANKAASKLTGMPTCKLPGLGLDSIISDNDILERASGATGEKARRESRINHTSGTWIPVEITLSPCEYGGVQAVSLVITDITERKKIEKQLDEKNREMRLRNEQITRLNQELESTLNRLKTSQQNLIKSERIAAITETAVAANHEINNPLFSILGHAQLLIRKYQDRDDQTAERLRTIEESALRIACVTKKLANLADPVVKEYSGLSTSMIDVDRSKSKPPSQDSAPSSAEKPHMDIVEHHSEDK
jgi:PAS domain S-box-containing protein